MIETKQSSFELKKSQLFSDLGYEPHEGQLAVHNSLASRRVLCCGVRWGKSLCAAMEAIAAALEPRKRSMGWVVAPSYELADKVYREIVIIAAEHLRHRIVTLRDSDRKLVLRNLSGGVSEIRAKSADNPTSLLGEGLDWLIVDEASRLKPAVWQSFLSQRLIDKKGWALLISTPKGKGWFYEMFMRGKQREAGHESWNAPSWQNPHLDRELIEKERERLPERVFLAEYEGKFIEGSGSVFRYVRDNATGEFQEPIWNKAYYIGLDLARVEDYTVLTVVNYDREVVFVDRFNRIDWTLQIQRIHALQERYNYAPIVCDTTGVGDPIYEALLRVGCSVSKYTLTQASKAALIDNLAILLEQHKVTLPRPTVCPEMIDELESYQYSVSDSGNAKANAPWGQHDDCVISLALAVWKLRGDPNAVPNVW